MTMWNVLSMKFYEVNRFSGKGTSVYGVEFEVETALEAEDSSGAIQLAKQLGFKNPIIEEVH